MVKGIETRLSSTISILQKTLALLSPSDRKKTIYVIGIYIVLALLDVFAVFAFGLVGSLAVNGVSSRGPGDKTRIVLDLLQISNTSLQVQVTVIGLLAAGILVLKSIATLYLSRKTLFFLSRRCAVMSQILIHKLLGQDILRVRKKSIQETIFSITTGVQQVILGVLGSSLLLFADLFLIFTFTISLFIVDFWVAILSLILFSGVGYLLYFYLHEKSENLGTISTRAEIYSAQRIYEVVNCFREITVKNRRKFYANEIGSLRMTISEASAGMGILNQFSKYIMEITLVFGCIIVGAIQFLTEPASRAVAVISIFLISSARIAPAVLRVQSGFVRIRTAIATSGPTIELVSELSYETILADEVDFERETLPNLMHKGFVPNVTLKSVSFKYVGKRLNAVNQVDLCIKPGEFVGIAGISGSGKSTLVDLMLGLLKPANGEVEISGLSPNDAIAKWPGAIAYVPQEVNIFSGSIKENVCLGFDSRKFEDREIEEILKSVKLADLLLLPDGIHSDIGERGNKLSGGQRQRLGIARALFSKPKILVLDEATSALDATTEAGVVEYFNSIKKNMTLIVIAHRLSTIKNADKIIYMKSGSIVGLGTFRSLVRQIPELKEQARYMGIK